MIKKIKGASNIYDCLVSSYHILGDWLAWKSGDGRSIRVGEDPFIGGIGVHKLSSI